MSKRKPSVPIIIQPRLAKNGQWYLVQIWDANNEDGFVSETYSSWSKCSKTMHRTANALHLEIDMQHRIAYLEGGRKVADHA